MDRIFLAGSQSGLTPTERQRLRDTVDSKGGDWKASVRSKWKAKLSSGNAASVTATPSMTGPAPEDISARRKTIWMPGFGDEIQTEYIADMARLAPILGFHIVLEVPVWASIAGVAVGLMESTGLSLSKLDQVVDVVPSDEYASVWGEDNKILTNGNDPAKPVKVLVPPDVTELSLAKAEAFTADEGYHLYLDGFQGAVAERDEDEVAEAAAGSIGHVSKRTKTYIEGGNLLPGTTSDGKAYAMVGRDTLVISAFHLDSKHHFSESKVASRVSKMKAAGRMPTELVEHTAKKLLRVKQWTTYSAALSVTPKLRDDARAFLAKLELTHDELAKDIDVPPERVVVITQPEFHIDMHLRPLAPGEVLVQHPARCIELIDEALQDPAIKAWERTELKQMRKNAVLDLEALGGVYDQIVAEIETAGLIPVLAPGVFESSYRLANFMNAVPGTAKNGETYFLTNASSIKPLERAFERFVEQLGVDRVEFLGGVWGRSNQLSASEYSLELAGGLDCREVNHAAVHAPQPDLSAGLAGVG